MNTQESTPDALIATARELFARHGYDGTSVRMITDQASANLGAISYHFGSKEALYAAVVGSVARPLYFRVQAIAAGEGAPLERIAGIIAAYFEHFADHPDMPKLVVQQIFTDRPLPPPLRESMAGILSAITGVLGQGQADGSIRSGPPLFLALSTLAQPIYFNIVRRPLELAGLFDLTDPASRREVVDHVTRFAIAGLTAPSPEST
jgi:AcrR family transcriptional regulator